MPFHEVPHGKAMSAGGVDIPLKEHVSHSLLAEPFRTQMGGRGRPECSSTELPLPLGCMPSSMMAMGGSMPSASSRRSPLGNPCQGKPPKLGGKGLVYHQAWHVHRVCAPNPCCSYESSRRWSQACSQPAGNRCAEPHSAGRVQAGKNPGNCPWQVTGNLASKVCSRLL